jgi:hypothetical protein
LSGGRDRKLVAIRLNGVRIGLNRIPEIVARKNAEPRKTCKNGKCDLSHIPEGPFLARSKAFDHS